MHHSDFNHSFFEMVVVHIFQAKNHQVKGLRRSFELSSKGYPLPLPKLVIFADPVPDVLLVRSILGQGTILLSQGLIGLLNEEELQMLLRLSLVKAHGPGLFFHGFCSSIVSLLLSLCPRAWVQLVFTERYLSKNDEKAMTPFSACLFTLLFPWIQFFMTLGKVVKPNDGSREFDAVLLTLAQRVGKRKRILAGVRNQELFSLFSQ